MNDTKNIIRWGIPGWSTVLGLIIFVFIDILAGAEPEILNMVQGAFKKLSILETTITGLIVAGAGIPLGYIIYQIYFYLRWNSPVSLNGLFPPLLVGRKKDLRDTIKDIPQQKLIKNEEWRRKLFRDDNDHRRDWHYLARIVMDAMLDQDEAETIYKRHNYLISMLHSLGASILGLGFGFILYVIFKWELNKITFSSILFPPALLFIIVGLLHLESKDEDLGLKVGPCTLCDAAELFLGISYFLFITVNPVFRDLMPFWLLLLSLTALAYIWFRCSCSSKRIMVYLYIFLLLIAIICRFLIPIDWLAVFDWPMIFTTLCFAAASIVFLENRQNVRDQISTMEYYYLRLFLSDEEST